MEAWGRESGAREQQKERAVSKRGIERVVFFACGVPGEGVRGSTRPMRPTRAWRGARSWHWRGSSAVLGRACGRPGRWAGSRLPRARHQKNARSLPSLFSPSKQRTALQRVVQHGD